MSSNGPPPLSINDVTPGAPGDDQAAMGVLELGDEFVRLSALLRQRAEEVSGLALQATSAEERCAALAQHLEEREREIVSLREQLDQVNARVTEFQADGSRHLAEMQNLTEEYAQRVATSERASEALRARATELQDQLAMREERNALLEQRIAAAVALESRATEAVQGVGRILDELRTLGDSDGQTIEPAPILVSPNGSASSALHTATQDEDNPVPPPAPMRGWYGLGRKVR